MLEQTTDDANGPLGFHAQHGLAEPGGGRRPEQPRALERRFRVRQPAEARVHDVFEGRARLREVAGRDRVVSVLFPPPEELLEHLVHELSLLSRVHHLLVVRFFLESQDALREELERTVEIGLERAYRPGARRLCTRLTMERGIASVGSRRAQRRPRSRLGIQRLERDRIERQRFLHEQPFRR